MNLVNINIIVFTLLLFKVGVVMCTNSASATAKTTEIVDDGGLDSKHLFLEILGIQECTSGEGDSDEIFQITYEKELNTCYNIKRNGLNVDEILKFFTRLGYKNKEVILLGTLGLNHVQRHVNQGTWTLPIEFETVIQFYMAAFDRYLTQTPSSTPSQDRELTAVAHLNIDMLVKMEEEDLVELAMHILLWCSYTGSSLNEIPVELFAKEYPTTLMRENEWERAVSLIKSYGLVEEATVTVNDVDMDNINSPQSFRVLSVVPNSLIESSESLHGRNLVVSIVQLMKDYMNGGIWSPVFLNLHSQTLVTHLFRLGATELAIVFAQDVWSKLHEREEFDQLIDFATHVSSLMIKSEGVSEFDKLHAKRVIGLGFIALGKYEEGIQVMGDTYLPLFRYHDLEEKFMKTLIDEIYVMYNLVGKHSEAMPLLLTIMDVIQEKEAGEKGDRVYFLILDRILSTLSQFATQSNKTLVDFLVVTDSVAEILSSYQLLYKWEVTLYGEDHERPRKIRDVIRELEIQLRSEEL